MLAVIILSMLINVAKLPHSFPQVTLIGTIQGGCLDNVEVVIQCSPTL